MTLLVFVRSGGTDFQIYSENFVEVRYYDSAAAFSDGCWEIAEQVIKFLLPNVTPRRSGATAVSRSMGIPAACTSFTIGKGRSVNF